MIAELADTYKWAHDFWRRMGWRELCAWVAAHNRRIEAKRQAHTTDPHTWDGRSQDRWWAEQDAKRGRQ